MRKKILLAATGLICAAAISTAIYSHQTRITNETLLANIEAITQYEIDPVVITCSASCAGGGNCWRISINWNNPLDVWGCDWARKPIYYCKC